MSLLKQPDRMLATLGTISVVEQNLAGFRPSAPYRTAAFVVESISNAPIMQLVHQFVVWQTGSKFGKVRDCITQIGGILLHARFG